MIYFKSSMDKKSIAVVGDYIMIQGSWIFTVKDFLSGKVDDKIYKVMVHELNEHFDNTSNYGELETQWAEAVKHEDEVVRALVASNGRFLSTLCHDKSYVVLCELAETLCNRVDMNDEEKYEIAKPILDTCMGIRYNSPANIACMRLAKLDIDALSEIIMSSHDSLVREEVALSSSNIDIVKKLLDDSDKHVRHAAMFNEVHNVH